MVDRHFLGDVALAVLIAVPATAFARPEPLAKPHAVVTAAAPSHAAAVPADKRPSLFG